MPELPEVETTLRGIQPHIERQRVTGVVVRHYGLRWPVPRTIAKQLTGHTLQHVERRAKYLLLVFPHGTAIIHLGMSGRLRILKEQVPPQKHDHFDICFANGLTLRFTDPRRFGAFLWTKEDAQQHPLLKDLGVEPLTAAFSGKYLYQAARTRKVAAKLLIMDHKLVVGVGNIYANEALFAAGIHPNLPANQLTLPQCQKLVAAIKAILKKAIKQGGTTLNDFLSADGNPGYFVNELLVYGKAESPCPRCRSKLQLIRLGQRSTVFCEKCQTK
jgi:formamidopyrimidine-DNA glycosylase